MNEELAIGLAAAAIIAGFILWMLHRHHLPPWRKTLRYIRSLPTFDGKREIKK